jgi:hypothetical protein
MVGTKIHFTSELAPCGKSVGGEHYRDMDDDGLLMSDEYYTCGCRLIRHAFHDGSVRTRIVRHDGKVIMDEVSAEHGC